MSIKTTSTITRESCMRQIMRLEFREYMEKRRKELVFMDDSDLETLLEELNEKDGNPFDNFLIQDEA